MKKLTLTLVLLSALCGAQTIPQVTTNLLTFPGPAAPQVQNVFAQVVGSPGVQTYYVWVVGDYTIGNSTPSPAAVVRGAPAVLTASNYILVSWQPPSGVVPNSYDVLLTTTDTTPSGACNCAAVVATAGPQYSIVSNTLQSYTVTTYSGTTTFNVSNQAVGGAESRLAFAANAGGQFWIDNLKGITALHPAIGPNVIETVIFADQYAKCDGITDDSVELQDWLNAVVAAHAIGMIPAKTCTYATPLVVGTGAAANNNWGIEGVGAQSTLKYTGTTASPAFEVDGTPGTADNYAMVFRDFAIQGDTHSTDDFLCISCHESTFSDLRLRDTTGAGLHLKYGEGNVLSNVVTNIYEEPGQTWTIQQPANCIIFDQYSSTGNEANTTSNISPTCQGVSGVGIDLKSASNIVTTAPEIQADGVGYEVDYTGGPSTDNSLVGATIEPLASADAVLDNGNHDYYAANDLNGVVEVGASGRNDVITGGNANSITVDSGALNTSISGVALGSGGVTDNGTGTVLGAPCPNYASGFVCLPSFRRTIPGNGTVSGYTFAPQDRLSGWYQFTTTQTAISNTVLVSTGSLWRIVLSGVWTNDADSGALTEPGGIVIVTSAAPTVTVGTDVVTFGVNSSKELTAQVTTGTADVYFSGTMSPEIIQGAGNALGPDIAAPSIAINGGTAITGQTGTGGTVVMSASPTLTGTPVLPSSYTTGSSTVTQPSATGTLALTSQLPLSGSVSITASSTALAAVTGTASITGATTGMACVASAAGTADPDAFPATCYVSAANTVTVQVVTRVTDSSAPAITYNIRVIQ